MADVDVTYDPITVLSGPVSVGINGLDDLRIRFPDPIETKADVTGNARADVTLHIPEPVRTDGKLRLDSASDVTTRSDVNAAIDLQPVVLDQCLRLSLAPLPPTRVCLPSQQRIALSLFGIEIVGLTIESETRLDVSALPAAPFVRVAAPARHDAGGLRIRLGS